ncbi:MAG: FISUMP domain-containing protein [Bacteroidota bacterium]
MKIRISPLLLLTGILFLSSCGQDDSTPNNNNVSFSIETIVSSSGRITQNTLENAKSILVTIENMDGSPTEYTLEKLQLFQVNDEFISEKITMSLGEYRLVEFFVVDEDENVTHITPLVGSEQAQNVNNPLPIQFTVAANEITVIAVEVISSEFLTLEDFGLAGFNLSEVDLFQFLLAVSAQGDLNQLLGGTLTVTTEDYHFTKELSAIANNAVVIKDGYEDYQITIESNGYNTYNHLFSRADLAEYESTPLHVELTTDDEDVIVDARGGQSYKIVQIGTQIWMAENLRATKYQNGDEIGTTDPINLDISTEDSPQYQWSFNGDDENVATYGKLYTHYVALDDRNICPEGWHIPSMSEFGTLIAYLIENGYNYDGSTSGNKLGKAIASKLNWDSYTYIEGVPGKDPETNNSSGFNGLGSGIRTNFEPYFAFQNVTTFWWSSETTEEGLSRAFRIQNFMVEADLVTLGDPNQGAPCRCLKD